MGNLWDAFIEGYNSTGPSEEGGVSAWSRLNTGTPYKPMQSKPVGPTEDAPQIVDEAWVVEGLVDRGMPEHVAKGFAMNMGDESNFNAGINEIEPLVEGSRGGFGLSQWTGPRRRQLEAFAKEKGTSVSDPNMQLDFLVWELENTEKAAAESIYGTSTAGEAGAAIVNKFLRPHEKHRERRASKYLAGGASNVSPPERPRNKLWLEF